MEIICARVLGYCMGVRRAVESAEKALNSSEEKIYTLGPLIHNPVVLNSLEKRGLSILKEDDIQHLKEKSTVIIRAHGTTPGVLDSLKNGGHTVIDATCPRVHLSQKRAAEYAEKGFTVIIAGDRNHGEVVSIAGYAKKNAVVIENTDEAQALDVPQKSVLIAQTTFSPEAFEKISDVLKEKNPELVVFNSICTATMERQTALKEIAGKADGILIIGGKTSANTRRLFLAAEKLFPRAALIEDADGIPEEFFSMKKVALTAGASTPDAVIEAVKNALHL